MAVPYAIIENYKNEKKNNVQNLFPPSYLDNFNYITKTFFIKYCEENVLLNEICHFRTEIEAYPSLYENNLFMECELMFYDTVNSIQKYDIVKLLEKYKIIKLKFLAKRIS